MNVKKGEGLMIRFIHAADLHLGQPMKKIKTQNKKLYHSLLKATEESFFRLIDIAINEKVDFVLLAGDLYDNPKGSLQEQFLLKQGLDRLAQANIKTYMLFGNHDHLAMAQDHLRFPEEVTVFPREITTVHFTSKNKEEVAITGFSYDQRWIREDMARKFPKRFDKADYHLGMFHGQERQGRSDKDHYCPFTRTSLEELGYDYWALGHIHKSQILQARVPIVYPGNIQGTHFKEKGPKGACLVTLSKGREAEIEFVETTDWQFYEQPIKLPLLDGVDDLREVFERTYQEVKRTAEEEGLHLLTQFCFQLSLTDKDNLLLLKRYGEELMDQLRWQIDNKDNNFIAYPITYSIEVDRSEQKRVSNLYQQALLEKWQEYKDPAKFEALLQALFRHYHWQRYLKKEVDDEQFQEDVYQQALNKMDLSTTNYRQKQWRD